MSSGSLASQPVEKLGGLLCKFGSIDCAERWTSRSTHHARSFLDCRSVGQTLARSPPKPPAPKREIPEPLQADLGRPVPSAKIFRFIFNPNQHVGWVELYAKPISHKWPLIGTASFHPSHMLAAGKDWTKVEVLTRHSYLFPGAPDLALAFGLRLDNDGLGASGVMRFLGVLAFCAALAGCAAAPHQVRDRDDYLAEGTRVFPGETRERVLKAAETVLKISDPADFEFRYTLTGFTGLRRYFIYAVLASASGREKWDFLTEADTAGLRASVSISEEGTTSGGYSTSRYEGALASVPLYRLFWSRVEYMLNKRQDWVTCEQAAAELEATHTNTLALGGLCGLTSDGRNAPAPDPLPPLARPAPPQRPAPVARQRSTLPAVPG